jgi:VanZ family protein
MWKTFLFIFFLALLAFIPSPPENELRRVLFDLGHLPAFALLFAVLVQSLPQAQRLNKTLAALLITVGIAALIELVQPYVERSGNWRDLLTGVCGALLAAGWCTFREKGVLWRILVGALAVIALAVVATPVVHEVHAVWWRHTRFPLLFSPQESVSARLWHRVGGAQLTSSDEGLIINFRGEGFSGAEYRAGSEDWSTYARFIVTLYNPDDEFTLYLRVDDSHDCTAFAERFNGTQAVLPGENIVEILLVEIRASTRPLDLSAIHRVLLFAENPEARLILREMRLAH